MKMALKTFIEERGEELVGKNLYRNFVLHCCNLLECGVIGPAGVHTAITRLQTFIQEHALSLERWRAQRRLWCEKNPESVVAVSVPKTERKDFSGLFKTSGEKSGKEGADLSSKESASKKDDSKAVTEATAPKK